MRFFELLKKAELRWLFGKRELAILEKQLWGVDLSQSEKNRLSRDIRRKMNAIALIRLSPADVELKKGAEWKERVEETLEILRSSSWFSLIRRITLFGSSVNGNRHLLSDIDLCVELDETASHQSGLFRLQINGLLPEKVDLSAFNELDEKVKSAVRQGKILYERADKSKTH